MPALPVISPDGSQVAFSKAVHKEPDEDPIDDDLELVGLELRTVDTATREARTLLYAPRRWALEATWSPDSSLLACIVHDATPGFISQKIHIIDRDGTPVDRIDSPKTIHDLAWSPDSQWLLCSVFEPAWQQFDPEYGWALPTPGRIGVFHLHDKILHYLTSDSESCRYPLWLQGGSRILYYCSSTPEWRIATFQAI